MLIQVILIKKGLMYPASNYQVLIDIPVIYRGQEISSNYPLILDNFGRTEIYFTAYDRIPEFNLVIRNSEGILLEMYSFKDNAEVPDVFYIFE